MVTTVRKHRAEASQVARGTARRQVRTSAPGRTDWARQVATGLTVVPFLTKTFTAALALSNPGISETIRRTRGSLWVMSDQGAALEDEVGAMGFIMVNDVALALGATAIPGPVTEASDDGWFLWQPITQRSTANVNSAFGMRYDFDSKAMRTVDEGFGVAVMVENASATFGLSFALSFSILTSRR